MTIKKIGKAILRHLFNSKVGFIANYTKNLKNSRNPLYRSYVLDDSKPTVFAFKINGWKQEFIKRTYPEYNWIFANGHEKEGAYKSLIKKSNNPVFLVWGYKEQKSILRFAIKNYIPVWRMEDGFIRSIGLGAHHNLPLSLVIDKSGHLYFDPSEPSALEELILTKKCSESELKAAGNHIKAIKDNGVSKYNLQSNIEGKDYYDSFAKKKQNQKRILVIGQVEDDASIQLGGCGYDNGKLVAEARLKNPDAQIFFKVHPDVLAGKRKIKTPLEEIENIAHIVRLPMSMSKAFESIDEVYTISSLAGFEALIHGKDVIVAGQPFYAGYGLTTDLNPLERRIKGAKHLQELSKEDLLLHVFYSAYILYPKYFNIFNGNKITPEEAINMISLGKKLQAERQARKEKLSPEIIEEENKHKDDLTDV